VSAYQQKTRLEPLHLGRSCGTTAVLIILRIGKLLFGRHGSRVRYR